MLIKRADQGESQIALISSEPGVGKTRLIQAASEIAKQAGFVTLLGECFEQQQNLPYSVLVDLLRWYADEQPGGLDTAGSHHGSPDFVGLLSGLNAGLPAQQIWPRLDPSQLKQRLFYTIEKLISTHIGSQPLLFIVEDIHWSDAVSLEFLLYWMRRNRSKPVLLLLSYRDEDPGESLVHFLPEIQRIKHAHAFHLDLLTMHEVELMLRAIFAQQKPVSEEFVLMIYQLTEGNPFFIEEVLKSLVSSGEISFKDFRWERNSLSALHVPQNIQSSVLLRLQRLAPHSQETLKIAAVVGRRFDYRLLVELTGRAAHEIVADLRELVNAQLVFEEQAEIFSFRHALTREAVYFSLLELERRHLHQVIAQALERLQDGEQAEFSAALSYHTYQSGNWQKVLEYSKISGENALRLNAPREAVVEFSRQLESIGRLSRPSDLLPYRQRGRAYEILGDFERARRDYERALQLARQAGAAVSVWECLVDLGFLWLEKDYQTAGAYLQQALSQANSLQDPSALARSYNRLGNWYLNQELPEEAVRLHEEALQIFSNIDDRQGLADTLDLLGTASTLGSSFVDSFSYFQKAVAIYAEIGDRRGMSSSLAVMAENCPTLFIDSTSLYAASVPQATGFGEQSLSIAQEIGWRAGESYTRTVLGLCCASCGDFGGAFEHLRLAREVADEIDHLQWIIMARIALGAVYLDLMSLTSARLELEAAHSLAVELNSPFWIRYSAGYLGLAYVSAGSLGEAARIVDQALGADDSLETLGKRLCWIVRLRLALERRLSQPAVEIAGRLLSKIMQVKAAVVDPWQVPPRLLMWHGEALRMEKRFDESEAQLKAALFSAETAGARALIWRIHHQLGECYRSQRRFEAAEIEFSLARSLLVELASSLPSASLRDDFLARTGQLFPSPPAGDRLRHEKSLYGGLTRREREIAWHVGRGLSNRAISENLFLSERTVERHVSHILDKLGFASRTQIITWALQNDIEPTSVKK